MAIDRAALRKTVSQSKNKEPLSPYPEQKEESSTISPKCNTAVKDWQTKRHLKMLYLWAKIKNALIRLGLNVNRKLMNGFVFQALNAL
jgi:hypothetical protein